MIDMTLTAEESKQEDCCVPASGGDGPKYPYGLSLSLDNISLTKLGIGLPEIGASLTLSAKVTVTNVSTHQEQDGDMERSCSMQITDMQLDGAGPSAAAVIYGGQS